MSLEHVPEAEQSILRRRGAGRRADAPATPTQSGDIGLLDGAAMLGPATLDAERAYSQEQFTSTFHITLACAAMMVLVSAALAVLSHDNEAVLRVQLVRGTVGICIFATRARLHLMNDQYRALTLFSRLFGGGLTLFLTYLLLDPPPPGSEPASLFVLCSTCALNLIRSLYGQYTGILVGYRRFALTTFVSVVYLRPAWSVLGRP